MVTRQLHLRDNVGYVNSLIIPEDVGCNFLCLSDRQTFILRAFTFPFARWHTRVVAPLAGKTYLTDAQMLDELQETLDDLELQLSGGSAMGCESIAAALVELAAAIQAQTTGGPGSTTNVYCGPGSGAATWVNPLAELPNTAFVPAEEPAPPEPGIPPEGFDTWEEYRIYKCQAAHAIWQTIYGFALASSAFAGLELSAAIIGPALLPVLGIAPAAISPAGLVAIIAACIAVAAISAFGFYAFNQWASWWLANKDDIICGLYLAGAGSTAVLVLTDAIQEGIDNIVWTGALEGLESTVAPLVGNILTETVDETFVASLFKLTLNIGYVGVSCAACGAVDLLENGTFDTDLSGWTLSGGQIVWGDHNMQMHNNSPSTYAWQSFDVLDAGTYQLYAYCYTHTNVVSLHSVEIDNIEKLTWVGGADGLKDTSVYLSAGAHTIKLQSYYQAGAVWMCNWDDISIPGLSS